MITSLYNGVRFVGVAVGPPVFTWLLGMSRNVMFFSIAGLAALFGVVALFWLKPKQATTHGANGEQAAQGGSKATVQDEEDQQKAKETEAFHQIAEVLGMRAE
ncbi:hypothetical protein MXD81_15450, partial [Microbacteriaceae bacterium K1510]|nr:hypothetical protein [Microbacteriaceae bacterium K1510]